MMLRTIYIARHGYDSAWDSHEDTTDSLLIPPTGIPGDTPLSSHGILQSKELAHYLLSLDTQPDLIISSPYYRCVETAHYIAKLLDIPLYTDKGIGQWFETRDEVTNSIRPTFLSSVLSTDKHNDMDKSNGIHPPSDVKTLNKLFNNSIKTTWKDCVDPYLKNREEHDKIKGETKEKLHKRTQTFLQLLEEHLEKEMPDAENILLLTHAPIKISLGLNLLGYRDLLDVIDCKHDYDFVTIRSGCCSLDKYELDDLVNIDDRSSSDPSLLDFKWKITMNGNTVFLRNGEEKPWYFKKSLNDDNSKKSDNKTNVNKEQEEDKENTETVYVSLDLNSGFYKDRLTVEKNATFQYSGLNQDKPLFRIGNKLYEGEWRKLVGTELAFPNEAILHKRNRNSINNKTKNNNIHGIGNHTNDDEEEDEDEGLEDEENNKKNIDDDKTMKNDSVYDRSDKEQKDETESSEDQEQSMGATMNYSTKSDEFNGYNLNIDPDKHGEMIYRIKDRIVLTGLHPI